MKIDNRGLSERAAFALRLTVGVGVGLLLAWLGHYQAKIISTALTTQAAWRVTVYSTLLLTAFVWWAGAGTMRRLSLAAWGAAITVGIFYLAWHQTQVNYSGAPYAFLAPVAWLVLPLLFIAHELVSSADHSKRVIAPYPTYFDQAWKHGVQLLLALLFTGLFWGILWLGAALLGFIGFHWLHDLLLKDWFALPASGAAMACAVQLGDIQDKLLVNVRALVLSVLSWLLPVIAAIGLLFLGSLCASGLEPLWKTKAATATLLAACVLFVLLINAAYQQGDAERPVNIVMKWATRLACFLLLAFAGLATYSLWLRIGEYGLTTERVLAGAGVIIACLFGFGYAVAAVWPGRWLARVEGVNIAMAFVKVLVFLGMLTPVADPARLSVADQVARLQSGRTQTYQFDWEQLQYRTGRYGTAALRDLGKSGRTANIRRQATAALADDENKPKLNPTMPSTDDMRRLKVVYPAGGALPAGFDGDALETGHMRDCVNTATPDCTAAVLDLNGDGIPEVVVLQGEFITVLTRTGGAWHELPINSSALDDQADVAAFDAGRISAQPRKWSDLKIGKTTVTITGN